MDKWRVWLSRLKVYGLNILRRVRTVLDERAEKQKQAWAASLEYKRRYTNPDEAKRNRKRPS